MEKLKFSELNLSRELMRAIEEMGFEEATPIQAATIPLVMAGRDIIGQAQTGTGKTAAFGIPLLEMIDPKNRRLQAVTLCPTRELAMQVAEELKKLARHKRGIEIVPVYGGQPIDRQLRALKAGVQVVIGTPGRVLDHLQRRTLRMDEVKLAVLDEADEMLDMGFRDDIETILAQMPAARQTILYSATMAKPILALARKYQTNPEFIKMAHKAMTVPAIEQVYYEVKPHTKTDILCRLFDANSFKLALVFCNTKRKVDELLETLQARGYLADGLHGDMNQVQRDRVMQKFRKGQVEVLVATDVAARGLDIDDIEAVFNYDIPQDVEDYVHRIGRTARAGRTGIAFTFVVGREQYKIREIQKFAKTRINYRKAPTPGDIAEAKFNQALDKIKTTLAGGGLGRHVNWIEKLIADDYSSLDIAAALLKLMVGADVSDQPAPASGGSTGPMVKLFINIGKDRNVQVKDIVGSIANETKIPGQLIGKIRILNKYSFVEVPEAYADEVINSMQDNQIRGVTVTIERENIRSKR
ncbi:MAG TPA: DEAD/DEAH box helicase [bacterium]|nr:DEAD/DEAH box helicase [bacterium]